MCCLKKRHRQELDKLESATEALKARRQTILEEVDQKSSLVDVKSLQLNELRLEIERLTSMKVDLDGTCV